VAPLPSSRGVYLPDTLGPLGTVCARKRAAPPRLLLLKWFGATILLLLLLKPVRSDEVQSQAAPLPSTALASIPCAAGPPMVAAASAAAPQQPQATLASASVYMSTAFHRHHAHMARLSHILRAWAAPLTIKLNPRHPPHHHASSTLAGAYCSCKPLRPSFPGWMGGDLNPTRAHCTTVSLQSMLETWTISC
jgi:hypothetical protein